MDPGDDVRVSGVPEVERGPLVDGEEVLHVLPCTRVLPGSSGFNVGAPEFPGSDSMGTEDVLVDLFEFVPLIVEPSGIEGIGGAPSRDRWVDEGVTVPSLMLSSSGDKTLVAGIGVGILSRPGIWGSCEAS